MSNALVKAAKRSELVRSLIDRSQHREMREGATYMDGSSYHRVESIKPVKRLDYEGSKKAQEAAEGREEFARRFELKKKYEIKVDDVEVTYSTSSKYSDFDEFSYGGKHLLIHESHYFKDWVLIEDIEKYKNLAQDIIDGKLGMPTIKSELGDEEKEQSNGLIHVSSKEHLELIQQSAEEKAKHFKLIENNVQRLMEKHEAHLRSIRSGLSDIVEAFQKKIAKIQRVIHVIELYLGINEEILQFQEGEKASAEEPICFRQRVMYMDEEVGDPRLDKYGKDEGLDFRNISAFDDWLCKDGNYKKVIPEPKCVCAFKVRRNTKKGHGEATDNPFVLEWMESADQKTYILIRNGDNLYRIWVDLEIAERLFPHRDEIMKLQEEVIKHEGKGGWDERDSKKKLEDDHERYQRQFIMLQGLIDRTEILHPIKETIRLATIDLDTTKLVRLIYDDGPSLVHKGHVPFLEWMKGINEKIDEGSRIVITGKGVREARRFDERFAEREDHRSGRELTYHLPSLPEAGLYTVYKKKKRPEDKFGFRNPNWGPDVRELLCIRYNPGDEVRNMWDRWDDGHERKSNISYNILKDDDFILNFDEATIEDMEYYLNSRIDRRHYVTMMPILWELHQQKIKEAEKEQDFLLMIVSPFLSRYNKDKLMAAANEEMVWWKTKNKWKRALTKDDAKAFRMIGGRLKKRFKPAS